MLSGMSQTIERPAWLRSGDFMAADDPFALLAAWASKQSSPLESRHAFEKAVALYTAKFNVGNIARPPNWTGYRIVPLVIEFWCARPFRLHDRLEFRRSGPAAPWSKALLYP